VRRLLVVGFVPCGLLVGGFWSLVRAGSCTGHSDFQHAYGPDLKGLEEQGQERGYWDRWPATARVAGVLMPPPLLWTSGLELWQRDRIDRIRSNVERKTRLRT
jgi:hypothetical protein